LVENQYENKNYFFFSCSFNYFIFLAKTLLCFYFSNLKSLDFKNAFSKDSLKTYDNQVNILILGIPGENNDGPYLSDSIIFANYNFKTNQITTLSIPRDIWSSTLRDKINSAYAYGLAKNNILLME
jgi:anionic cell wall polymer biosynthesis LytR-Cps2A-Psr (LCP) family protein